MHRTIGTKSAHCKNVENTLVSSMVYQSRADVI